MPEVSLFLNDLTNYEVTFELDGERQMVRGLPLMRPGEFNDQEYSAADLTQMADNFERLRDELGWVPSLKPRHTYDLRGRPENFDARDVLARFDDLHFDADEEVLLGDVEVVDATMIADMEAKKLLYLSTEVAGSYVLSDGDDEEDIGPTLVGVAWVDDPAVKGLPWEIVINAAEYTHLRETAARSLKEFAAQTLRGTVHTLQLGDLSASELSEKLSAAVGDMAIYAGDDWGPWVQDVFDDFLIVSHDGDHFRHDYAVDGVEVTVESDRVEVTQTWTEVESTTAGRSEGGAQTMTRWQKFLAGLVAVLSGEAKPETLTEFDELEGEEEETPAPTPAPEADTPSDTAGEVDQLRRQLAQEQKAREEGEQRMTVLERDARRTRAEGLVDSLVREGHVPPAQRQRAYVLLEGLLASDDTVTIHAEAGEAEGAEPTETEQAVVQVLVDLLKGSGPSAIHQGPQGLVWEGQEDPGEASDAQATAVATSMAAMANESLAE